MVHEHFDKYSFFIKINKYGDVFDNNDGRFLFEVGRKSNKSLPGESSLCKVSVGSCRSESK